MYLAVACVLSVFDIGPVFDEDGNPRIPEIEFGGASVRCVFLQLSIHTAADVDCPPYDRDPNPFECTIKPRSEDVIELVKEACDRTNC